MLPIANSRSGAIRKRDDFSRRAGSNADGGVEENGRDLRGRDDTPRATHLRNGVPDGSLLGSGPTSTPKHAFLPPVAVAPIVTHGSAGPGGSYRRFRRTRRNQGEPQQFGAASPYRGDHGGAIVRIDDTGGEPIHRRSTGSPPTARSRVFPKAWLCAPLQAENVPGPKTDVSDAWRLAGVGPPAEAIVSAPVSTCPGSANGLLLGRAVGPDESESGARSPRTTVWGQL